MSASGENMPDSFARHSQVQREMLDASNRARERRWLLCEPYGGIGNMLATLVSCYGCLPCHSLCPMPLSFHAPLQPLKMQLTVFPRAAAASVASSRGMIVNWENIGTERPWSPPYEATMDSIIDAPPSLNWHLGNAARSNPCVLFYPPSLIL